MLRYLLIGARLNNSLFNFMIRSHFSFKSPGRNNIAENRAKEDDIKHENENMWNFNLSKTHQSLILGVI